jgi:toxoflavin biosynthesis protein ToxC
MIQHRSPISGIDAFDGQWVATAGYDNQVILWDARTKTALARGTHDHLANHCRFSACGRWLITAGSDHSARVWSVPRMKLMAVLAEHDDDVEAAVSCPASRRVATASRDGCVRVFSLAGRLELVMQGHEADVISVEWIAGGRRIVSSSDDGTVRLWDAATGALIEIVDLGGVESDTVVATPEGVLLVGNDLGDIVSIGAGGQTRVKAHAAGIKRLVFHKDSRQLVSAGYDRCIQVWSVSEEGALRRTHRAQVPPQVWLRAACFVTRSLLAFGTFGSSYAGFDLEREAWDLSHVEETPGVNAVLSFGGDWITTGDAGHVHCSGHIQSTPGSLCNFLARWDGGVVTGGQTGQLFDALSGRVLHQHHSPLNCAVEVRRENEIQLIVGTYTGEGLVFARRGDAIELVAMVPLHANAVKGIACNGSRLFSVDATGAAALHRIEDLALEHLIPKAHLRIGNGADSLPDGRFVSVSRDRRLRIWDGATPTVIETPHTHSIKCIRAGQRFVATGSYSGMVCLYDVDRKAWIHQERPTCAGISSLARAEEPDIFLASSYDGRVYEIRAAD